jgi:hypothetical protein
MKEIYGSLSDDGAREGVRRSHMVAYTTGRQRTKKDQLRSERLVETRETGGDQ